MNLFQLHKNPEKLKHHDVAYDKVPNLVWEKYRKYPNELKKREDALAADPHIAYLYAFFTLKERFRKGEHTIAKDPKWAYYYAMHIIKNRWPEGEDAIANDALYAFFMLKK